jgi:hypothetical protein
LGGLPGGSIHPDGKMITDEAAFSLKLDPISPLPFPDRRDGIVFNTPPLLPGVFSGHPYECLFVHHLSPTALPQSAAAGDRKNLKTAIGLTNYLLLLRPFVKTARAAAGPSVMQSAQHPPQ